MKKEHQKELIIAVVFFIFGALFFYVPMNRADQLNKAKEIENKKAYDALKKEYDWKTDRLRIYTDIIYKND